jgi:hypothetical protein
MSACVVTPCVCVGVQVDGYAPFCKHVFLPNFVGECQLHQLPMLWMRPLSGQHAGVATSLECMQCMQYSQGVVLLVFLLLLTQLVNLCDVHV